MPPQQQSGMVQRGLVLLGLMLILATVVGLVLFRPTDLAPQVQAHIEQRAPSKDGWAVRYNASTALARRGTKALPCDVVAEMLDEDQQLRKYMVTAPDGTKTLDEQAARRTVFNTLKAMQDWVKHADAVAAVKTGNAAAWQRVVAAIDKLTHSENAVLRQEAETLKQKIDAR